MKHRMRLALALAVWLASVPVARAAIALNGSLSALVAEDGATLVEPGAYARITEVIESSLFAALDGSGKFALLDGDGVRLTEPVYDSLEALGDKILYERDSLYGVMDQTLQTVVPCEYSWIVQNGAGGYLALRTDIWDDNPDGVYYIDNTGYVSPTGVKVVSYLMPFAQGLSPALSTDNGRYGYLNPEGQWALRPQYAYADSFENGRAIAMLDSGCGVIDEGGNWQITPKYDFVSIGEGEGALIAGVNYGEGVSVFAGDTCELLYALPVDTYGAYVAVGGQMLFVYARDRVLALNAAGEAAVSFGADALIIDGGEGRMIAYDGEWGGLCAYVLNQDGQKCSPGYQDLSYLCALNGTAYFIFTTFDANLAQDYVIWGDEGVFCGMIDETGREILPARFTQIASPAPGRAFAEDEHGMYLYDLNGGMLWSYAY